MNETFRRVLPAIILSAIFVLSALALVRAADELSPNQARKLIANMAGIKLPSNAVRVREVSLLGSSAVVVAQVETAFRFVKGDDGKWRVAEIRTGDNRWEDLDMLVRALNSEKVARARAEMETLSTALEAFRIPTIEENVEALERSSALAQSVRRMSIADGLYFDMNEADSEP